jgi:hypothetical protein
MDKRGYAAEPFLERQPGRFEILRHLSTGGSLDVRQASEEDMVMLLDIFNSSFDELTAEQQLQLLEGLLLKNESISDQEILSKVRQMAPEQKHELGVFLGRIVKPGVAVRSFHECWAHLTYDEQRKFEEEFLRKQPEHALMVAPFVCLNSRKVVENKDGKESLVPLTEKYFNSFDRIEELFSAMIDYHNQHLDDLIVPYHIIEKIRVNILGYPLFVLERLPELLENGLLREQDLEELIPTQEKFHLLVIKNTDQFLTDEEKTEEKDIHKLLVERGEIESLEFGWNQHTSNLANAELARHLNVLHDRSQRRRVRALLRNYSYFQDRIKNQEEFFNVIIDSGLPVLAEVDSLGMDKPEAAEFIKMLHRNSGMIFQSSNFEDLKILLEFNARHASEPNLENLVIDQIAREITAYGMDMYAVRELVMVLDEILPTLSVDNRQKLVRSITNSSPTLWFYNLDFALDNNVISLRKLVDKATKLDNFFIDVYPRAEFCLRRRAQQGKDDQFSVSELKMVGRKIFEDRPQQFGSLAFRKIYSAQEQRDFIERHLRIPVSQDFLTALGYTDKLNQHSKLVRQALLEQPGLFEAVLVRVGMLEKIIRILGIKETVHLAIERTSKINLEILLKEEQVMEEIVRQPRLQRKLLAHLAETGQNRFLGWLFQGVQNIKELHQNKLSAWQHSIANLEQQIKRARYLLTGHLSDKQNRIVVQSNLAELNRTFLELKNARPVYSLSAAEESQRQAFLKQIRQAIYAESEANRFFVFESGVAEIEDFEFGKLIRENIEDYMDIDPNLLFSKESDGANIRDALLPDELERLLTKHIRSQIFRQRYDARLYMHRTDLPATITELAAQLNPYDDVERSDDLAEDFYDAMLKKAHGLTFFPLYEKELRRLVREQQEQNGQQHDATRVFTPPAFKELINRLGILENCPWAIKNAAVIINLPTAERKEVINTLEFLVLNNLDRDLELDLEQVGWATVREQFTERVAIFVRKIFELEETDELTSLMSLPAETLRALAIYYRQSCKSRADMKMVFKDFIRQVVSGEYLSWRAWGEGERPETESTKRERLEKMKAEELLPANLSFEQYQSWLEEEEVNFAESLGCDIQGVHGGIKDVLAQAVIDHHVEPELIQTDRLVLDAKYEKLITPLQSWTVRQRELKQRFAAAKKAKKTKKETDQSPHEEITEEEQIEFRSLQEKVEDYFVEHGEEMKLLRAQRYLVRLESLSLEELEKQSLYVDGKKSAVDFVNVFRDLQEAFGAINPDFKHDLQRLQQQLFEAQKIMFGGERVSRSKLVITDKVDLSVHVLIGEKPVPSCQNYDSDSDFNSGLLSYLTDPNVKFIQIYDEHKNIVARAACRLLEDEKGRPTLFMERVYSTNSHPKIKETMVNFLRQKAERMGVPWKTHEIHTQDVKQSDEQSDDGESHVLRNRNSRSPFVYTDAGGGLVADGRFEVRV